MAQSILEALNKTTQPKETSLGTLTDETQRAQQLLTARSGKAVGPGTAPRQSNIAEQLAAQAGEAERQQLSMQGQLAGQSIQQQQSAEQQQQQQALQELSSRDLDLQENFNRQSTSILNDLNRKVQELDLRKDKAKVEQAGFTMRLANDQYIKNLQREGQKSRLSNKNNMQEEIARTVFANEEELLRDDAQFRNILKANDRSYKEQLTNIDLDFAVKMAEANNKAANQRMMWQGVGGIISGAAQASTYTPKTKPTPDSGESNIVETDLER